VGRIRNHFFETEGVAMSLGSFCGIDTEVDERRGSVWNGGYIKADWSPMRANEFPQRSTNLPYTDGIHSPGEKNAQGSVFDFVGEVGCLAAFDKMVHAGQREHPSNFARTVGNSEDSVATLEFSRSFKDQAEHGGTDISDILKIAGEVRGLPIQFRANREFQFLAGNRVETPGEGEYDSRSVVLCRHKLHKESMFLGP
jgi:hypothetical protein